MLLILQIDFSGLTVLRRLILIATKQSTSKWVTGYQSNLSVKTLMDPPLKKAVARNINNYFYHQSPQRSLKAPKSPFANSSLATPKRYFFCSTTYFLIGREQQIELSNSNDFIFKSSQKCKVGLRSLISQILKKGLVQPRGLKKHTWILKTCLEFLFYLKVF